MKVLLVHPGKQHSFETAKALKEAIKIEHDEIPSTKGVL